MKSFVLGGLVLLAVTACAPAFLEDLNKAAGLTGRMTMIGTVGAIGNIQSDTNVRFYPTKPTASSISDVNIQSGFVVSDSSSNYESFQFAYTTSDGTQTISNSSNSISLTPSIYPQIEYDVTTPPSGTATLVVTNFGTSAFWCYTVTFPNGPLTTSASGLFSTVFSGVTVAGIEMMPQQGGETFNFLLNSGVYANGQATFSSSTGFSAGATTLTYVATAGSARAMYGVAPGGSTGYASYYSGGSWLCYQMTSTLSTLLSGVANRIDAVLSSGDLLSANGGTLTLYDSSGSQLFSKPLNGLQYCYEAYVGSTPYVFFSLPMSLPNNQWVFNVYAIPTSSMRDLGK